MHAAEQSTRRPVHRQCGVHYDPGLPKLRAGGRSFPTPWFFVGCLALRQAGVDPEEELESHWRGENDQGP